MSLNDSQGLERTLEYCDKSNESFLNTTNVSISTVTTGCPSNNINKSIINQPMIINEGSVKKSHIHFNRLWSVWYGILVTVLQGYLIIAGFQKYIGCSLLTWKNGFPIIELNMQLIFCGLTLLFLPLFLASALFKVGNLANDGVKFSARKTTCSSDVTALFNDESNNSTCKALWMHGVPISVFIHIITALCLLLPHLLLEAKLIQNQHLPKDNIWKSEIDFILNKNDRLVILSFTNTSPYQNDSIANENENRFDDDIDALEYDWESSFKTHDSIKSRPNDKKSVSTISPLNYPNPLGDLYDDDIDEDDDDSIENEDYEPFSELIPTTLLTTTTTTEASTTTEPTTTPSTTTTTTTTQRPTTIETTSTTTTTTTTTTTPLPTTTTVKVTTAEAIEVIVPSTKVITNSPIAVEKSNGRHKNQQKNRKNNHKKHQKQQQVHVDESTQTEENPEFRYEDFEDLGPELKHQMELNKSNGNAKRKQSKSNGRHSSEQMKPTKNYDSMESSRPRSTQRAMTEKSKIRNSEIVNVRRETTQDYSHLITTAATNSDIIKIKSTIKRSVDSDGDEIDDEEQQSEDEILLESALPSISEDGFILKDENGNVITNPSALVSSVPNFNHSTQLDGIGKFLQSILGINEKFDPKQVFQESPNLEFINLAIALLVWSVRYPSVFWESSKAFALIFSFQLLANSFDILMLYVGASILFKLQVVGEFVTINNGAPPFLLNGIVTLALTLLAFTLVISSSMILYLYGHARLAAKIRDCRTITLKEGDIWSYFSHCASLCFILALAVVKAPIIHDLSVTYRISFDKKVFTATMISIIHIFLWIVVWLALTAKRRWAFKLPVIETIYQTRTEAIQPLLTANGRQINFTGPKKEEETIYWPAAGSPKLKVTFDDELPSTLNDRNLLIEHDGKRPILSAICDHAGETDEGEYATLKNNIIAGVSTSSKLHFSEYDEVINIKRTNHANDNGYDDTGSEEGKLLACVQDESITYASTRILEPPPSSNNSTIYERFVVSSESHISNSSMAPVTVQVHSELQTSTPRFIRRGDSGMPHNEALTPKSDTNSTGSSASPPERGLSSNLSESSSGVHSGEDNSNKEEVVIRPRPVAGLQKAVKPIPAVIEEEPYGRITSNMKMSSFKDATSVTSASSNTLPHNRGSLDAPQMEYPCNTMPHMPMSHQMNRMSVNHDSPKHQHTTLPSNVRYSAGGGGHYMRQMSSQMKHAESPYATGLGSGHHTFSSRFIQNEPLPPPPVSMPQSHSHQQFGITRGGPVVVQQPIQIGFDGLNRSYQMVLNEMCANNNQSGQQQQQQQFPPPPPSIAH